MSDKHEIAGSSPVAPTMQQYGDLIELSIGTALHDVKCVNDEGIPEYDIKVMGHVTENTVQALYLYRDKSGYHQVMYDAKMVYVANRDMPK